MERDPSGAPFIKHIVAMGLAIARRPSRFSLYAFDSIFLPSSSSSPWRWMD
jgi:hypothetical protein